jgi:hypothetical protein
MESKHTVGLLLLKVYDKVLSLFPTLNFFQVSLIMASTLGVPVKLLHEALGHVITVELKTGQLYRGKLADGAYYTTAMRSVRETRPTDASQISWMNVYQ